MGTTARKGSYKVIRPMEFAPTGQAMGTCYLPVLGVHALSLYNFLVNDGDVQANIPSVRFTHDRIAQSLNVSETELDVLRARLEGISLLATYIDGRDPANPVVFYELRQPLSIAAFLDTPVFGVLLEKRIGSYEIERIEFAVRQRTVPGSAVNVSSTFDTVFANQIVQREPLSASEFAADLSRRAGFAIAVTPAVWKVLSDLYATNRATYDQTVQLAMRSAVKVDGACEVSGAALAEKIGAMSDFANLPSADDSKVARDTQFFKGGCEPRLQAQIVDCYKTKNAELYLSQLQSSPLSCKDRALLNQLRITLGMTDETINVLVDFATQRSRGRLNAEYLLQVGKSMNLANVKDANAAIAFFREIVASAQTKKAEPVKRAITAQSVLKGARLPEWVAKYDPSGGQSLN